jgi:hypothetical protein
MWAVEGDHDQMYGDAPSVIYTEDYARKVRVKGH